MVMGGLSASLWATTTAVKQYSGAEDQEATHCSFGPSECLWVKGFEWYRGTMEVDGGVVVPPVWCLGHLSPLLPRGSTVASTVMVQISWQTLIIAAIAAIMIKGLRSWLGHVGPMLVWVLSQCVTYQISNMDCSA